MELKELQEYAQALSVQQGWDKETIQTRLNYLKSEVLEAEIELAHIESSNGSAQEGYINALGLELFDILWNVAELANRFNIDLTASAEQKMKQNSSRTFSAKPVEVEMVSKEG